MLKRVSIVTIIFFLFQTSVALAICPAGFINPITDIAWTCTFPIRFAGIVITPKGKDPGTWVRDPICVCKDPFPRIGLTLGLWEPARLIEVVKDPFCFPSLGFQLSMGNNVFEGGSSEKKDKQNKQGTYFAQAHYFIFPIWTMLELLIDFICLEHSGFDLAYMTELDPLWNDDMLTLFINPEAILFGNPAAQFICIADSAAAAVNFSIDSLFWCMGSWGSAYPLTGNLGQSSSQLAEASAGIAARLIYKLHRELVLWGSAGHRGLCGYYPMPIWKKSQYKLQPAKPVPQHGCPVVGRTGLEWSWAKNPPVPGKCDNMVFILWRNRDCCAF